MPQLGFGTYLSPPDLTLKSCLTALKAGYRHIDTAQYYQNEAEVGEAIRQSGLAREDVFVTTKVLTPGDGPDATYASCLESVEKIGGSGGYVDCFLIHSPNVGEAKRKAMWLALERLYREGRAKSIGTSNFGRGQIEGLKGVGEVWPPHVNQIEVSHYPDDTACSCTTEANTVPPDQLHPWHQQREIVQYCQDKGIVVQAYCPIVRNQKADEPMLVMIAKSYGVTPNQVLIRWSLEKGWVSLPKSDNPDRIRLNCDVYGFDLDEEDVRLLDDLDQGAAGSLVQTVNND